MRPTTEAIEEEARGEEHEGAGSHWLSVKRNIARVRGQLVQSAPRMRAVTIVGCNRHGRRSTLIADVLSLLPTPETRRDRAFADARQQLAKLAELNAGWDGPDAVAVPPAVVERVRTDLRTFHEAAKRVAPEAHCDQPWLAASADGSIGIDWRCGKRQLAVTYDVDGETEFYARGPSDEKVGTVGGDYDAANLTGWILTGRWA
jgi:hypothetical protein